MAKELDEETKAAIAAEVKRQLDVKFPNSKGRRGTGAKPAAAQSEGEKPENVPAGKVFGKCPRCDDGVVTSDHTRPKDPAKPVKVVFKCSNNDYRDKESCQFAHWGSVAELEDLLPKEAVNAAPRATATAEAKPDRARLAQSINQRLNKLSKEESEAILAAFGKPEGKLAVAWLFAQDTAIEVLQEVDKALG